MSLGGICYILLPNKFLCVASAQATAFSTGEDGQDAPVDTPAQSVGLQVVEQTRHDVESKYSLGTTGAIWNILFLRDIFTRDPDGGNPSAVSENLKSIRISLNQQHLM